MGSVKTLALAGAAVIVTLPAAYAADLPPVIQRPPAAVVEEFGGGWYLRGDIGFTNMQVGELFNAQVNNNVPGIQLTHADKGFDSSGLFGVGVGYQFTPWLRADVTGEYRMAANFHGLDITRAGGTLFPDSYSASASEFLFLANVYADLGTWWCITPFVGAGVGVAWNQIAHFRDLGVGSAVVGPGGFGGNASTGFANAATNNNNLAWALHAGLAYKATPGLTIELAYRYLNLGKAQTGDLVSFDGQQNLGPMEFRDLISHDVKLGVRWKLQPEQPPAYVVTKG